MKRHFLLGLILVLLGFVCNQTATLDVLALLPLVSPSNHQFHEAVLMALARRGHRVTVYSQFPPDIPHPRYRHIRLDDHPEPDYNYFDRRFSYKKLGDKDMLCNSIINRFEKGAAYVKNNPQLVALLRRLKSSTKRFDVLVMEPLIGQEHLMLFSILSRAPVVVLEPFGHNLFTKSKNFPLMVELIPEPSPSFSDEKYIFSLIKSIHTLNENARYVYIYLAFTIYWYILNYPLEPRMWYLANPNLWQRATILTLVNEPFLAKRDPSWAPVTIPIAGIHIDFSPPPLSKELQQFLDSTKRGFVVIDMDATESMTKQSSDVLVSLVQTLPGLVVWRTTVHPNNSHVRAVSSLPQTVLAHPNCKLLITDGTLLRVQEAIYFGVPVLAVPQSYSQHYTAAYIKVAGIGKVMDPVHFHNLSKLLLTVNEIRQNKLYKTRANIVAEQFRKGVLNLERAVDFHLANAVFDNKPERLCHNWFYCFIKIYISILNDMLGILIYSGLLYDYMYCYYIVAPLIA